jgi:hypothetical protein
MRIWGAKTRAIAAMGLTAGANAVVWIAALLVFRGHLNLLEWGAMAYVLGLAHALDADHICAIDNVTRKLMQEGQRPTMVGFFFSVGHSTVVLLLTIAIAVAAGSVQSHFSALADTGGLIGTFSVRHCRDEPVCAPQHRTDICGHQTGRSVRGPGSARHPGFDGPHRPDGAAAAAPVGSKLEDVCGGVSVRPGV